MARGRMILVMLAVLAVGAIVGALAASSGGGGGDLEQQVKTLSERVASLEQQLDALKQNLPPSQELEQQAAAAVRDVKDLAQLDSFMAKYGKTRTAQQVGPRMREELSVVGKDSPSDWHIAKWFQGENEIKLDGKGPTMVVFWETWCPHCQREVPEVEKLYTKYKSKGLQIIGVTKVTRDATDDKVVAFIKEKQLTYPIAKEDGQLTQHFNVAGIPAAAVVKNGKVVWRGHPAALTEEMLQSWL